MTTGEALLSAASKGSVAAIHQPNFFPWLGYFDKIARSDVFVLLDGAQFQKTGGAWMNRVKLLVSGEARWLTAAIDRSYHGTRTIREMEFLSSNPWREKALKTIESNYRKHPHYRAVMPVIEPLIGNPQPNIAEYNIHAIRTIAVHLGLDASKLRCSSELPHEGSSNEMLCSLTALVGGSTYMCGGGADGYQDTTVFVQRGIKLIHQNFVHPTYEQHRHADPFVAGLSVIDALMNVGWETTAELIGQPA